MNRQNESIGVPPLFVSTRRFFIAFGIYIVISFCLPVIINYIGRLWPSFANQSLYDRAVMIQCLVDAIIVPVVIYLYRKFDVARHLIVSKQAFYKTVIGSIYSFGLYGGILLLTSGLWVLFLLFLRRHGINVPLYPQDAITLLLGVSKQYHVILFIILAVIFAPIIEEIMFRYLVYRFFKGKASAMVASIVTGIVFAGMHGNFVAFVPLFVLNICLCRAYERYGDIRSPMIIHGLFNAMNIFFILAGGGYGQCV